VSSCCNTVCKGLKFLLLFLLGYIFTENKIFQTIIYFRVTIAGYWNRSYTRAGFNSYNSQHQVKKEKKKNPHITGIFVSDKSFVAVVYGGTF